MKEKIVTRRVWNRELCFYEEVEYRTGKYHFTDEDKIQIVSEYVQGNISANEIIEKHHINSRQTLFNWMDKFVNEHELVSLSNNEIDTSMAKDNPQDRIKELESKNKQLQQALALEKLRSKAFDTMINVAEETFNIPIRKKSGTKR